MADRFTVDTVNAVPQTHFSGSLYCPAVASVVLLHGLSGDNALFLKALHVRFYLSGQSCDHDLSPAGVHGRVWLSADLRPSAAPSFEDIMSSGLGTVQEKEVHSRYRVVLDNGFNADSIATAHEGGPTAYDLQSKGFEFKSRLPSPGLSVDQPPRLFLLFSTTNPVTVHFDVRLLYES